MCKKLLRNSGSLNLSTKDRENVVTEIAGKYNGSLCLSNMNVSAKHIYSCDINNSRDVIKNNIIDIIVPHKNPPIITSIIVPTN